MVVEPLKEAPQLVNSTINSFPSFFLSTKFYLVCYHRVSCGACATLRSTRSEHVINGNSYWKTKEEEVGNSFQETCSRETKGEVEGKAKDPAGKDQDNILHEVAEGGSRAEWRARVGSYMGSKPKFGLYVESRFLVNFPQNSTHILDSFLLVKQVEIGNGG